MTQVEAAHVEHEHKHPSDFVYFGIAIFLAFVTGAEVALYYLKPSSFILYAAILLVLMVCKFATVAMFFMHLRFDSRVFRWMFCTGVFTATIVYLVVLSTFHVFLR